MFYISCVTNDNEYVALVVSYTWSFSHSWIITGFVTRDTRRVPLVEQELPTLPEHLRLPPFFIGICVVRSSIFCVMFCRSLFAFLSFFFWPLCCLSFVLRILVTRLVSSNSSCPFSLTVLLRYTASDCLFGFLQTFLIE